MNFAPISSRVKNDPRLLDVFWSFIHERQLIFERRRHGEPPPWTDDLILARHRFTNTYRAADRVSQFLINEVQYTPDASQDAEELIFRSILFRLFNQIATYRELYARLGEHPSLSSWDPIRYGDILSAYVANRGKVWNNAYMMTGRFGEEKHRTFLNVLDLMIKDELPKRISSARRYLDVFNMIRQYTYVADFLGMQYATDINYSTAIDFDEDSFIMPGIGSLRGLEKLGMAGGLLRLGSPVANIYYLTQTQDSHFQRLGLTFPYLGGTRRLHLMDVQNCLCEFDKYARVAYPDLHASGTRQRTTIKSPFEADWAQYHTPIVYKFPPKWGLPEEW